MNILRMLTVLAAGWVTLLAFPAIADTAAAIALMQAQPSLIRRPVVEFAGGELVVGLDPAAFERLAGH